MLNDKKPVYIRVCERMKCEESKKKGLRLLIFPIDIDGMKVLFQKPGEFVPKIWYDPKFQSLT